MTSCDSWESGEKRQLDSEKQINERQLVSMTKQIWTSDDLVLPFFCIGVKGCTSGHGRTCLLDAAFS